MANATRAKGRTVYLRAAFVLAIGALGAGCNLDSVRFGLVDTRDEDGTGQYRGPDYAAQNTEDGALTTSLWNRPDEWYQEQENAGEASDETPPDESVQTSEDAPIRRERKREDLPDGR